MIVPAWTLLPFALLLGAIATFPLLPRVRELWHHQWFQLTVSLSLGVPMAAWVWLAGDPNAVLHALVEYAQFLCLLGSLYVVAGGVYVSGDVEARPLTNTLTLALGALLASLVGTTGAAMLLIRPLLNTNQERVHRTHTVVFAIFIVANCGGLLTPLGDPPLFLGMLRGVPFFWTLRLFPQWLFLNGCLLAAYLLLERRYYAAEPKAALERDRTQIEPLRLHGAFNLALLAVIVAAVAFAPSADLHALAAPTAHAAETHAAAATTHAAEATSHAVPPWLPLRELLMLGAAACSLTLGDRRLRWENNEFSWAPILEVAGLFIGIFLTMIPALKYLAQVAPALPLTPITFYLFSGSLSAVLDNAPTYATFFGMAQQLPGEPRIANVPELSLIAISTGSVFWGAMTYIGNGPNFMVKAIAESAGVPMPSFGAYVALWTVRWLLPLLLAVMLVFLSQSLLLGALGLVLAAALVGSAAFAPVALTAPVTPPAPPAAQ